jgi:hypothetical protein
VLGRLLRNALRSGRLDAVPARALDQLQELAVDLDRAAHAWADAKERNAESGTRSSSSRWSEAALTPADLAGRAGVSVRRAQQVCAAGLGVKRGHRWEIDPDVAAAWLAGRTEG